MSDLKRVVKMAERMAVREADVATKEAALKQAKADLEQLKRVDLPELMREMEITMLELADGVRLELTDKVTGSITKAKKADCVKWLVDNGFGGLVKTAVSVELDRGEIELAESIRSQIQDSQPDLNVSLDANVHHSTFSAFVRESVEEGRKIPRNLFSVHEYSEAKIIRK